MNDSDFTMEDGRTRECPVCQTTFASNQSMMRHKKTVHEAIKSFQCDICLKSYTQAWTLKAHRLTHSEKKPWKCWCGTGFAEKKFLIKHQKVRHTEGNPPPSFPCKHCNKEFGYAYGLRKHIKRKHENKHSCEQCGDSFKLGSDFRNHILDTHNGTEASKKLIDLWDKSLGIVPAENDGESKVADMKEILKETEHVRPNLNNDTAKDSSCTENVTSMRSIPTEWVEDSLESECEVESNLGKELDADSEVFECNDNSNDDDNTANDNIMEFDKSNDEHMDTEEKPEDITSKIKDRPETFIPSLPLFLAEQDANGLFPCDICNHMFPMKGELRIHKLFEHEGLRFQCAVCRGIFFSQLEMKEHKRLCSSSLVKSEKGNRDPLVCDLCGFVARRPDAMRQHRLSRHEGVSYKCDKCPKEFMQERNLKLHVKQVHESEPLLCDQCDYKTQREDTLKKHKMNMHGSPNDRNDLNKIFCDACEFSTTRLDTLRNHKLSVHQGVRYNCPECDKFFTQERNMKMHIKVIHLRETELSCDQCEYTTLWKDSMHQHIKTKHEGVAYECHICLKSLSSQRQLEKHIEVVHNCQ